MSQILSIKISECHAGLQGTYRALPGQYESLHYIFYIYIYFLSCDIEYQCSFLECVGDF